jgi:hypothetical protein
LNKRYRKHKGQSIMDELETHATLGTRHRTKTNKKIKHNTENKKDEQHVPVNNIQRLSTFLYI